MILERGHEAYLHVEHSFLREHELKRPIPTTLAQVLLICLVDHDVVANMGNKLRPNSGEVWQVFKCESCSFLQYTLHIVPLLIQMTFVMAGATCLPETRSGSRKI